MVNVRAARRLPRGDRTGLAGRRFEGPPVGDGRRSSSLRRLARTSDPRTDDLPVGGSFTNGSGGSTLRSGSPCSWEYCVGVYEAAAFVENPYGQWSVPNKARASSAWPTDHGSDTGWAGFGWSPARRQAQDVGGGRRCRAARRRRSGRRSTPLTLLTGRLHVTGETWVDHDVETGSSANTSGPGCGVSVLGGPRRRGTRRPRRPAAPPRPARSRRRSVPTPTAPTASPGRYRREGDGEVVELVELAADHERPVGELDAANGDLLARHR